MKIRLVLLYFFCGLKFGKMGATMCSPPSVILWRNREGIGGSVLVVVELDVYRLNCFLGLNLNPVSFLVMGFKGLACNTCSSLHKVLTGTVMAF